MNKKLTRRTGLVLLAVLMTLTTALGYWVVIYNWSVTLNPVAPPIVFEVGENANVPGIWGQTIAVTLSPNQTQASISLPVTYGLNEFNDILYINNTDLSNGYNVSIAVTAPVTDPFYGLAELVIVNGTTTYTVNLTVSGVTNIGYIPPGGLFVVGLRIEGVDGQPLPASSTVSLQLLYNG